MSLAEENKIENINLGLGKSSMFLETILFFKASENLEQNVFNQRTLNEANTLNYNSSETEKCFFQ